MKEDGELQMMCWLFLKHHMLPSSYRKLGTGEKIIIRAFFLAYQEETEKLNNQIGGR